MNKNENKNTFGYSKVIEISRIHFYLYTPHTLILKIRNSVELATIKLIRLFFSRVGGGHCAAQEGGGGVSARLDH